MTNLLIGALLTLRQVAEQCAVSEKTVRRWIASGDLPAYRLGGQLRISPDALAAFLERCRTQ